MDEVTESETEKSLLDLHSTKQTKLQQQGSEGASCIKAQQDNRRGAVRLLAEAFGDVACRRAVFSVRHRVAVALIVRAGVLAYEKDSSQRKTLTETILVSVTPSRSWTEVKVAVHQLVALLKLWTVEAVIAAHDVWPCLGDPLLRLSAVRELCMSMLVDLAGPDVMFQEVLHVLEESPSLVQRYTAAAMVCAIAGSLGATSADATHDKLVVSVADHVVHLLEEDAVEGTVRLQAVRSASNLCSNSAVVASMGTRLLRGLLMSGNGTHVELASESAITTAKCLNCVPADVVQAIAHEIMDAVHVWMRRDTPALREAGIMLAGVYVHVYYVRVRETLASIPTQKTFVPWPLPQHHAHHLLLIYLLFPCTPKSMFSDDFGA
jgi:hypothetical protein